MAAKQRTESKLRQRRMSTRAADETDSDSDGWGCSGAFMARGNVGAHLVGRRREYNDARRTGRSKDYDLWWGELMIGGCMAGDAAAMRRSGLGIAVLALARTGRVANFAREIRLPLK